MAKISFVLGVLFFSSFSVSFSSALQPLLCDLAASGAFAKQAGYKAPSNPPPLSSPVSSPARPFGIPLAGPVKVSGSDFESFVFNNSTLSRLQYLNYFPPAQALENMESFALDGRYLTLVETVSVRAYFVAESAINHNSFGISRTNGVVDATSRLLFPDASKSVGGTRKLFYPLLAGDFVEFGSASAGSILYPFLVVNGAKGFADNVLWGDEAQNSDGQVHMSAHALAHSPYVILGFEDKDTRQGDRDFNDLVIVLDVGMKNVDSLIARAVPTYVAKHPDCSAPAPLLQLPILVGSTKVQGLTSQIEDGVTVTVFVNGVVSGKVPVSSSTGEWSVSLQTPLAQNDEVSAVVIQSNGDESPMSSVHYATRRTSMPTIRGPILAGTNRVSGSAGREPVGTVIKVYSDDELVGTTSVKGQSASGESWWTIDLSSPLTKGSLLTATSEDRTSGKAVSQASQPAQVQTRTSTPFISTPVLSTANGVVISGAVNAPPGTIVRVFADDEPVGEASVGTNFVWTLGGVPPLSPGTAITATATAPDSLPSLTSDSVEVQRRSMPPSINAPLVNGQTKVSGTCPEAAGTTITLFVDGRLVSTPSVVDSSGHWSMSGIAPLRTGCVISAMAINTLENHAISEPSKEVIVEESLEAIGNLGGDEGAVPTVTISRVDRGTGTVSGSTSSVPAGAIITVLSSGITLGSAVVDPRGSWTLQVSRSALVPGATISAWITTGDISTAHATFTISADSDTDDSSAIQKPSVSVSVEGLDSASSSVSGEGYPAGSIVRIFIGTVPVGTVAVDADRKWSLVGIGSGLLHSGVSVGATLLDADDMKVIAISQSVVVPPAPVDATAASSASAVVSQVTASENNDTPVPATAAVETPATPFTVTIQTPNPGDRIVRGTATFPANKDSDNYLVAVHINNEDIGLTVFGNNGIWSVALAASHASVSIGDRVTAVMVSSTSNSKSDSICTAAPVVVLPNIDRAQVSLDIKPSDIKIDPLSLQPGSTKISGKCDSASGYLVTVYVSGIPIATETLKQDGSFQFARLSNNLLEEGTGVMASISMFHDDGAGNIQPRVVSSPLYRVHQGGGKTEPEATLVEKNDAAAPLEDKEAFSFDVSDTPPLPPSIDTPIFQNATAITGTCSAPVGSVVTMFLNGKSTDATSRVKTAGVWKIELSDGELSDFALVTVRLTDRGSGKFSDSLLPAIVTPASAQSLQAPDVAQPVIAGTYRVSGKCVHPLSEISVLVNGHLFASGKVSSDGTWEAVGPAAVPHGAVVTAVASDPHGTRGTSAPSPRVIASNVQLQSTTVIGGVATTIVVTSGLAGNASFKGIAETAAGSCAATFFDDEFQDDGTHDDLVDGKHLALFGLPRSFVAGSEVIANIAVVDRSSAGTTHRPRGVTFSAVLEEVSLGALAPAKTPLEVTLRADGTTGFTISEKKAGNFRLFVSMSLSKNIETEGELSAVAKTRPLPGSPFEVTVLPGQARGSASTASGSGVGLCAVGSRCALRVVARDTNGNLVAKGGNRVSISVDDDASADVVDHGDGTYTAALSFASPGDHTVRITLDGAPIRGSPFSVVASSSPGAPSSARSVLEPPLGKTQFASRAGEEFSVVLRARSSVGVELSLDCCAPDFVRGNVAGTPLSVSRNADGTWLLVGKAPPTPGTYSVIALIDSSPVPAVSLTVFPGAASAARSKVSLEPERPAAGADVRVVIELVDFFGNSPAAFGEADAVHISLEGPGPVSLLHDGAASRASDSMFVGAFSAASTGAYTMTVSLNGFAIGGSTFRVDVIPGALSAARSSLNPHQDVNIGALTAGIKYDFVLDARDSFGNVIQFNAQTADVTLSSTPSATSTVAWSLEEGMVSVQFEASAPAKYTLVVATAGGRVELKVVATAPLSTDLVSAILSDSGTELMLHFSSATDRADVKGGFFSCDLVLDAESVLSQDSSCSWVRDNHLRVLLGSSSPVSVGSQIKIRDNSLRSRFDHSKFVRGIAFVQAPENPRCVVPIIMGAPRIGSCDALVLDASRTAGLSGRSGRFRWSLLPSAAVTVSASLAATLKVVDGPLLTVGPNDLAPGVRYTFQLVVTNWLGGSGTAEFVVDKVRGSAPVLSLETVRYFQAGASGTIDGARLGALITPSTCGCQGPFSIRWSQVSGPALKRSLAAASTTSSSSADLLLPPLSAGEYVFTLSAACSADPAQASFAATRVVVSHPPLQVTIAGGAARTVSVVFPLGLQVSVLSETSGDSNTDVASLECSWSCSGVCFQPPFSAALLVGAPCKFSLPAQSLAAGTSTFSVNAKDAKSGRSAAAAQTVQAASGCSGTTSVTLISVSARRIVIAGCSTTEPCPSLRSTCKSPTLKWNAVSGDIDLSDHTARSTEQIGPYLVLKTGSLTPGQTYALHMDALCPNSGLMGHAEVSVTAPMPPSGGSVTVTPSVGIAGKTEFLIRTFGWTDSDSPLATTPLRYEFWVKPVSPVSAPAVPLAVSATGTTSILLPLTTRLEASADISVIAFAVDHTGARSAAQTVIQLSSGIPAGSMSDPFSLNNHYDRLLAGAFSSPSASATTIANALSNLDESSTAVSLRVRLIMDAAALLTSLSDPLEVESILWITSAVCAGPLSLKGFEATVTLLHSAVSKTCVFPTDGFVQAFGNTVSGLVNHEGGLDQHGHDSRMDSLRSVVGELSLCLLAERVPGEDAIELHFPALDIVLKRFASSSEAEDEKLANHQFMTLHSADTPDIVTLRDGTCAPFAPVDVQSITWKVQQKVRSATVAPHASVRILRSPHRLPETGSDASASARRLLASNSPVSFRPKFSSLEDLIAAEAASDADLHKEIPTGTSISDAIEVCGFWDRGLKSWSRVGCIVSQRADGTPERCDCFRSKTSSKTGGSEEDFSVIRAARTDKKQPVPRGIEDAEEAAVPKQSFTRVVESVSKNVAGAALELSNRIVVPYFVIIFYGILVAFFVVAGLVAHLLDVADSKRVLRRKHDSDRTLAIFSSHTLIGIFIVAQHDVYNRLSRLAVLLCSVSVAFSLAILLFRMFPHTDSSLHVALAVALSLLPATPLLAATFKTTDSLLSSLAFLLVSAVALSACAISGILARGFTEMMETNVLFALLYTLIFQWCIIEPLQILVSTFFFSLSKAPPAPAAKSSQ